MELILFTTGLSLTFLMILYPCWQAQQARIHDEYREVYHAYRLRMVRRCYPDLRHLTFSELEETYDIDQAFNNIGKFRPQSRMHLLD